MATSRRATCWCATARWRRSSTSGTSGVGDPACDLVIAWTYFRGAARGAFVDAVARDAAMWARARAWALWKALIVLRAALDTGDAAAEAESRATLAALLHRRLSAAASADEGPQDVAGEQEAALHLARRCPRSCGPRAR